MKKLLSVIMLFLMSATVFAQNAAPTFMEAYMKENNIKGTIIIENLKGNKRFVYNKPRSEVSYLPASTFKIINTLIALEEGVTKDEKEYVKWDGSDKHFAEWNKDQNILSAFPSSCVWFYQELARRIGNDRYLYHLQVLHYGNGLTGKNVDTFWLDGELKISAKEQITVLKSVYGEKYPFQKKYYAVLKQVMIVDKTDAYTMRAKTGWTVRVNNQMGWYVGWLETKSEIWFFACNLDIAKAKDEEYRQKITYRAFKELGIIP